MWLVVARGERLWKLAEQADTVHVVGGDKDKHGCIASAGYTWSEAQKDCIRLWEKGVRMNAVDDAEKVLFLVFSPDSTKWNCSFRKRKCRTRFWSAVAFLRGICLECGR